MIFSHVTPCRCVNRHQIFRENCCFQLPTVEVGGGGKLHSVRQIDLLSHRVWRLNNSFFSSVTPNLQSTQLPSCLPLETVRLTLLSSCVAAISLCLFPAQAAALLCKTQLCHSTPTTRLCQLQRNSENVVRSTNDILQLE
jgi:hypothetical protein